MTAPSIVVRGATTALTRRTTLRKAFLAPWHPLVEQLWLYCLADAQRATDVAIHHSVLVLTHHHTSVTPSSDNLPEFLRRFHRDFSCALHTLLCRERYDAPRELFDDRSTHRMRLVDASAQASHLIYEHLNPVAAGLVRRPEHMPLRTLDFGLWRSGGITVTRPPVYFGRDRPEQLELTLTPPPELYLAFGGDLAALVHQMKKLSDEGMRALHAAMPGEPLGARALRRMHPWSEPRTMREPGGERVPTFKIGAAGMTARTARIKTALEVRHFRAGYRDVFRRRREGNRELCFPFGTYAERVYRGAPVVSAPSPDAIAARPGLTLAEAKAMLGQRAADDMRSTAHAVAEEVRAAWADEATDVAAENRLDVHEPTTERTAPAAVAEAGEGADAGEGDTARPPALTRHRFAPRAGARERAARIVVLRDRRRGRPPGVRHGSDPPAAP